MTEFARTPSAHETLPVVHAVDTFSHDRDYVAHGAGVMAAFDTHGTPVYRESGPITDHLPPRYEKVTTGNTEVDRYRSYDPMWVGAVIFRQNSDAALTVFEAAHPHIILGRE